MLLLNGKQSAKNAVINFTVDLFAHLTEKPIMQRRDAIKTMGVTAVALATGSLSRRKQRGS